MKVIDRKHELDTLEVIKTAESVHRQARQVYLMFCSYQRMAAEYLHGDEIHEETLNKYQKLRLQACRDECTMFKDMINAADEVIDNHGDEKLFDR